MKSMLLPCLTGGTAAYLLGAIPFGLLIGRARGVDVRTAGSRNIGATNVFRTVGKVWGLLAFACDTLKGLAAATVIPWLMMQLVPGQLDMTAGRGLALGCACLAIAGHNWPVYLRFRGGKGVATSVGALLGLAPLAALLGLAAWLVVFAVTRYVSVASMLAAVAVAAASWWLPGTNDPVLPIFLTVLALLVIARHQANLRRLLNGTENRFKLRPADNQIK